MKKLFAVLLTLCMALTCAALAEEAPAEPAYRELAAGIYQINGSGLLAVGSDKAAQFNPNARNEAAAAATQELAGDRELLTLSFAAGAEEAVDLGGIVLEPVAFSGALEGTAWLDAENQILFAGDLLGNGTVQLNKQHIAINVADYINGYRAYLDSVNALNALATDDLCIICSDGSLLDRAYLNDVNEAVRLFVEASTDIVLVNCKGSVGDFAVTVGNATIIVHMPFFGLYGYDLGGSTLCTDDSDYKFYITDYGSFNSIRDTDIQSMYVLMNDTEALLLDCDMYNGQLFWETVSKLVGDRELSIYITHQHVDHVSNLQFVNPDLLAHIYWPVDETAPSRGYNPFDDERIADKIVLVDYDTVYNFAGRELVFHKMTAHTSGGSVVIDRTDRVLFSGDALGTQTWRGGTNTGRLTVQQYLDELNGLTDLYGDDFDEIYQAHNLFSTPYVIDYLKILCNDLLENGTAHVINGLIYGYNGSVLDAEQFGRIFGNDSFDSQDYYSISLSVGKTAMEELQAAQ